jgi:hemoglobin/transferrin/lactoferrin receptor protein
MSEWTSSAAYLTYLYRPTDKFTLQSGVRYNLFSLDSDFDTTFYPFPFTNMEINDGAITGSLGAIFKPDQKWTVSTNLSTGFRAPNVDDAGKVFDSEPGYVIVPNPDLKAEYAYNAEIDVAKVFGEFLRLDVAGYYTYLDDAMVRRDYTLNGQDSIFYGGEMSKVQAIQNAAYATVYGIQAGLEIKLPDGFGITSQLNWQKGDEVLDDGTTSPLRHAAPMFGMTSLSYTAQKLKLEFYGIYSEKVTFSELPREEQSKDYMYAMDADGKPYSPSWYTINFKATYIISENFSVNGGLENLTDQRYRPYSSGLVAPGRNFVLSLKIGF